MADNFRFAQLQPYSLAGSGAISGAITITLKSMTDIDGNALSMSTTFGSIGFGTLEPGNGDQEEQICFTGLTNNSNGTVTLSGISNVLFTYPYTQTVGLSKTHPGSSTFVISNTSGFYDKMTSKSDDETITGLWNFPNDTNTPTIGTSYAAPTSDLQIPTKKYVDTIAFSGANLYAVVVSAVAGETLVNGNLVYFKESDQRWWKTDADAFATSSNIKLGVAMGAGSAGVSISNGVTLYGYINNQSGLTPGSKCYVSGTTGSISQSLTTIPRFIGWAISATEVLFSPDDLDTNIVPSISGEALSVGNLAYFKTSDGKWYKTDADASSTSLAIQIGIVQTLTSATDQLVLIRLMGLDTTQTSLVAGTVYYVSGTAGALSTTAGTNSRVIGTALTTNQLLLTGTSYDANSASSLSFKFGGDGSDGALTVASGTTTIDLAGASLLVKNYSSVSITGTGAVAFSNPHANGSVIIFRNSGATTITTSATRAIDLRNLGASGGAGSTTAGNGTDGSDSPFYIDVSLHGGTGGFGDSTNSASGGSVPLQGTGVFPSTLANIQYSRNVYLIPGSGGGGGGGPNGGVADGGAGGRGAGSLYIESAGAYNCTGTIDASGTTGTVGVDGGGAGGGGGGGGGAGGLIIVLYNSLTADSGTYTVTAGSGAVGGNGTANNGGGGGGGGALISAGSNGTGRGTSAGVGGNGATGVAIRAANNIFA